MDISFLYNLNKMAELDRWFWQRTKTMVLAGN